MTVNLNIRGDILNSRRFNILRAFSSNLTVQHQNSQINTSSPTHLSLPNTRLFRRHRHTTARHTQRTVTESLPRIFGGYTVNFSRRQALAERTQTRMTRLTTTRNIKLSNRKGQPTTQPTGNTNNRIRVTRHINIPNTINTLIRTRNPTARPLNHDTGPFNNLAGVNFTRTNGLNSNTQQVIFRRHQRHFPAFNGKHSGIQINITIFRRRVRRTVRRHRINTKFSLRRRANLIYNNITPQVGRSRLHPDLSPVRRTRRRGQIAINRIHTSRRRRLNIIRVLVQTQQPIKARQRFMTTTNTNRTRPQIKFSIIDTRRALNRLISRMLHFRQRLPQSVGHRHIQTITVRRVTRTTNNFISHFVSTGLRQVTATLLTRGNIFRTSQFNGHLTTDHTFNTRPTRVTQIHFIAHSLSGTIIFSLRSSTTARTAVKASTTCTNIHRFHPSVYYLTYPAQGRGGHRIALHCTGKSCATSLS